MEKNIKQKHLVDRPSLRHHEFQHRIFMLLALLVFTVTVIVIIIE